MLYFVMMYICSAVTLVAIDAGTRTARFPDFPFHYSTLAKYITQLLETAIHHDFKFIVTMFIRTNTLY